MASVDDIFKSAGLNKRKLEVARDTNNKSRRLATDSDRGRPVRSDGKQSDSDVSGEDLGPQLPPDDEAEDEEGRFFGGGISKQESQILDYVDDAGEGAVPEIIDSTWLRKTALSFEKRITKNAELRAKFESDPQRFIGSEADLDSDIKSLSILGEHPELYSEFVKLGCAGSLVGLLAHENTDIAIDAIEIIGELTDEDVAANDEQWGELADALMDAGLLDLLGSNLSRLDEDDETDRNGVYYALGILENLCSRDQTATRVGKEARLIQWLIRRIRRSEVSTSQNKQYAAEIIALMAQTSESGKQALADAGTTDALLQLIAQYRRRDPDKNGEEEEYMENLFEALTCIVSTNIGKAKFVEAEGVELCLIMLKEGKKAKVPTLRLLDHAVSGAGGVEACYKIVEAGGLKNLFTVLMRSREHRPIDHLVSIFANMLRRFPAESPERIRTLAKFVEKNYEKTAKLVRLFKDYVVKVAVAARQAEINIPPEGDGQNRKLAARYANGLFTLQFIAVILTWLVVEDSGAKHRIKKLLADHGEDIGSLRVVIKEQMDELDTDVEDSKDLSDMLGTVVEFLD